MQYLVRVYEAEAAAVDELVTALWAAGTLGVEEQEGSVGRQRLTAYFADGADAPAELPARVRLLEEGALPAADWLATYRRLAQPLRVGERLVLDPREPPPDALTGAASDPTGRIHLRIPARSAFGTGSHASTRLALRLLEREPLAGRSLLDVGVGSGVLALAAVALGARHAVGLDLDLAAALLAGQHGRMNRLPAGFWAGSLAALVGSARFDVVVVNALPHEVLPEASRIAAAVGPAGRLILSGVLAAEAAQVLEAWAGNRLAPAAALAEEEWIAWTLHAA